MTEILYAMGLGNRVVGVSNACDRPTEVRNKAKVGGMPNPSLEAILALKPDMVVMTQEGNPKSIADRLTKLGKKIYVFKANRLPELPTGIREMGQALGARDAAEGMARSIETAMTEVSIRKQKQSKAEKALFVIWPKPLIVAGGNTIINDAMKLNGLTNIAADTTSVAYPHYSVEAVMQRQPDIIIIGAAHDPDMKRQSKELMKHLGMLDAVRKGRVCYVGDALYRPGSRIAEGLAELKQCEALR
ncbi:hypothetical protein RW64_01465 [Geobacter sulfurreducens]|nr:hypothetical protein RW64_01465 [Geobacter sulfurreducens]